MKLPLLLVCVAALMFGTKAAAEPPVISDTKGQEPLHLDVSARVCAFVRINEATKAVEHDNYFVTVESTLTNIGKTAITVPTGTYEGPPHRFTGDDQGIEIWISASSWVVENRIICTPSPFRFFPVVLQPGESTALSEYRQPIRNPSLFKHVTVVYDVDKAYAIRHGWWFGHLKKEVIAEPFPFESDEQRMESTPNKAAEPSRSTVTPPAGAGDRASGAPGSP